MENNDLPDGWSTCQLGEVLNHSNEKWNPEDGGDHRYLSLKHLEKDSGRILGHGSSSEVDSAKNIFSSGDVLYGKLRPYLNKVARPSFDGVCSTDILVFTPSPSIDSNFLKHRLRSTDVVEYANQKSSGINLPRVNLGDLSKFEIALPPLAEQRRIADRLDAIQSRTRKARETLSQLPRQIEEYRQSVLNAAFTGQLTVDWREDHPDVEPADELLERILEERRKQWEKDYRAKYEAKGKELPKYWKNRYSPPEEPDLPDDLQEIPGSWEWTSLGYMCDMTSGGTPKRSNDEYWQGDIPWLKSGELNDGVVTEAEERITEKGLEESSTNIFPSGTLLVALYGATTGKLGILDFASATNQAVCGLFITDSLDTKYVFWYLRQFRPELLSKRFGGAQKNISQTILRQVPVPLPPLDEQKQIVDEIERLLSVADDATATAEREHTRAERLRQSILKQAFSGRLVPHDEDATPPAIESSSSDGSPSSASEETDSSSGEDDVIAEELYNGGDPGKQIEMDL
jgi:type I restriction enzyme S subunit